MKRKLNYRFHDPNPATVTADYILQIFMEANVGKVEAAMQKAAGTPAEAAATPSEICQERSA